MATQNAGHARNVAARALHRALRAGIGTRFPCLHFKHGADFGPPRFVCYSGDFRAFGVWRCPRSSTAVSWGCSRYLVDLS